MGKKKAAGSKASDAATKLKSPKATKADSKTRAPKKAEKAATKPQAPKKAGAARKQDETGASDTPTSGIIIEAWSVYSPHADSP